MSRPLCNELQYISIPSGWYRLPVNKIIRTRLGAKAFLIWEELYMSCFDLNGYYRELSEDDLYIIANEYGESPDMVRSLLDFLAERSLINAPLLREKRVLTSPEIQRIFQEASKGRGQKRAVEVRADVWLLSPEETRPFIKIIGGDHPQNPQNENADGNSEKNPRNSEKKNGNSKKNTDSSSRKERIGKEKKGMDRKGQDRTGQDKPTRLSLHPAAQKKKRSPTRLKRPMRGQSVSRRGELLKQDYRRICGSTLPPQGALTEELLAHIRRGTLSGATRKDYIDLFRKAAENPFLTGGNGRWRASFGWLVTPENMKKVLSGAYEDYKPPKKLTDGSSAWSSFDTDQFFEAAVRRSQAEMLKYCSDGAKL